MLKTLKHLFIVTRQYELSGDHPPLWIKFSILISFNAIFMALADFFIEILVLAQVFEYPFRKEFTLLTIISTLLAFQTLRGIRKMNLDLSEDTLQVALLVEVSLVIGDLLFLSQNPDNLLFLYLRIPFIVLTSVNVIVILVIQFLYKDTKERMVGTLLSQAKESKVSFKVSRAERLKKSII